MNLRAYQSAAAPPPARRVEGMTREEACQRYARKVLALARRTCEQAGPGAPFTPEDLVGYGVMGLLEAFDRFDGTRGTDFTSYAALHISGRILDAVRAASGTTRRDRRAARAIAVATVRAREELGREPSHGEIAARLGVDLDGYWTMRGYAAPTVLVALPGSDTSTEASSDTSGDTSGEPSDVSLVRPPEVDARLVAADARQALRDAIARLPERDRQCVLLYYARDCSLAEIAAILEVTPSRVSQILTAARVRLRKAIGDAFDADDLHEGAA
ncbi:MAG: sigma-70 family RNA polymerase sigma factor [Myxococcota bacterium]